MPIIITIFVGVIIITILALLKGVSNDVNYKISIRGGSSAKKKERCCCSPTKRVLPKIELFLHLPSLHTLHTCSQPK